MAFFDWLPIKWQDWDTAIASLYRRIHKNGCVYHTLRNPIFQKENDGFDVSSKPPLSIQNATLLPKQRFYIRCLKLSVIAQQNIVIIKKEPITMCDFTGYRLCVLASGSLITNIFNCLTLIRVSCLHFGQNRGKFSSIVSSRIFNRVLLPQTGHIIHLIPAIVYAPICPYNSYFRKISTPIAVDINMITTEFMEIGSI